MFRSNVHVRKALLAALMAVGWLLALAGSPAQALQEPPAVKALLDLLRVEMQLEPKVGRMRTEGDAIVLENVVLGEVRREGRTIFFARVEKIRLTGAGDDDGLMRYGQIALDRLIIDLATGRRPPLRITIPASTLTRASLLPRGQARTPQERFAAGQLLASAVDVPLVRVELPDIPVIEWTGIKGTWQGDRRTGAGEGWLDLGTLPLPLMELAGLAAEDAAMLRETLQRLGLQKLTLRGEFRTRAQWTADQRLMQNLVYRHGAAEAGEFTVELRELALPLELLDTGRRMRDEWGARQQGHGTGNSTGKQDPAMPGMRGGNPLNDPQLAMSVRRLTLGGLTLNWRDHGLVRRLLAWQAGREKRDVSELVADILQRANGVLSAALPPEMTRPLLRELSRFLQEPKSLRLSIGGANGQPLALANAVLLFAMPQMLLNTVRLEVKANEDAAPARTP